MPGFVNCKTPFFRVIAFVKISDPKNDVVASRHTCSLAAWQSPLFLAQIASGGKAPPSQQL